MTTAETAVRNDWISGYLGMRVERGTDDTATMTVPVDERLDDDALGVHPVALLMAIDMAAGLSAGYLALPRWTLTVDMSIAFLPGPVRGELRAVGTPTHIGGRLGLAEVSVSDGDDRTIAIASVNHALVPTRGAMPFVDMRPGEVTLPKRPDWAHESARDLYRPERVPGQELSSARLPLTDATTNPWGLFHGAVLGHLALDAAGRAGITRPESLTIRFLRPTRVGPAHAAVVSTTVGTGGTVCVVHLTDTHDDTLTCLAHVRGR
ncbi:PaaI family thioesterase [Gordonia sp. NPDC003376]